jgi:glycosidase
VEKQLAKLKLDSFLPAGGYFKSPIAWEDQVFYFLMLDRFSDGQEQGYLDNQGNLVTTGTTPLFAPGDRNSAVQTDADAARWRAAGGKYVGGTLNGLTSKIGYLKRLGVTAIWISPIFKQVAFQETYHGYGIQDFLAVNPRFGTAEDLKTLVQVAHAEGIYVILDIILNHTGNIFSYDSDRYWTTDGQGNQFLDPRWDGKPYKVKGFNDASGQPTIPFRATDPNNPATWPNPDAAVWPVEFQDPALYTQKGRINSWDNDPEYLDGDFFDLKDVHHGQGDPDHYAPSAALNYLCQVYQYWIAFADLDGFRIDTVKHMDLGATRFFASMIHEFAQSLGKENFYLIGEITGGRSRAFNTLEVTGLNAALGIDEIPEKLEYLVKGYRNPADYFGLFRNSMLINKDSHIWFKDKVVTMFDDHDQVRKGQSKARFCADPKAEKVVFNALALNAMTLGIPCIYYGSEQCFDGHGNGDGGDRYLREAMFGGEFGPFASRDKHCFDETNPVYQQLAKVLAIRQQNIVLRRGRQYLRAISAPEDGVNFGFPTLQGEQIRSVIPWSRVFSSKEVLLAINTDYDQSKTAWVTIDNSGLHQPGQALTCIYSTDTSQIGQSIPVESKNGKAVLLTVPAAGFVIYE